MIYRWLLSSLFCFSLAAAELEIIEDEARAYSMLSERFKTTLEKMERDVHRIGNQTLELESFASVESDYETAVQVLSNLRNFPVWLPPGLNARPDGVKYYLQLKKMSYVEGTPEFLDLDCAFEFPMFTKPMHRKFKMTPIKTAKSFTLKMEALPEPTSVVESLAGSLRIFKSPLDSRWIWIYSHGKTRLRNALLYELVPDKVLRNETGERIQQMIDNYHKEEVRVRALQTESKPQRKNGNAGRESSPDSPKTSLR